jgi:EAL domain-containing protein (putative c-di-GMP-specific phosphodiesterase class I)
MPVIPAKTSRISLSLLLLLLGSSFLLCPSLFAAAKDGPKHVIVAPVVMKEISDRVEALGTARANESINITSSVTEKVSKVGFEDGQKVQTGDVLVVLDQAEEQANLRQAQAVKGERELSLNRQLQLQKQKLAAVDEIDRIRLELEQALTVALEHNEFELHYQPQVNAQGVLLSAEALIRWRRDGHGMVSPLDFIPVAEETGLIVSIGEWVIRTACEFICELDRGGDLLTPISVNVSARQFRHADFIKTLQSIIQQTGVDPQRLGIELTESLLVEDVAQVTEIMTHVRALGIKVSIDDFGTGYSALSYLKDLPIDVLKVDRAFVRDIHKDKNCAAIAEAILAMAKNLGMGVVAEGVEVAEELEFLMARGCDVFQGFFFSRPLSVEQFKAYGQNQGQYQPVFRAEMLGDEAVR